MPQDLSLSEKVAELVLDRGIQKEDQFTYQGSLSDGREFSVTFVPGSGIGQKAYKLRWMEIHLNTNKPDQIGYRARETGAQNGETEQGLDAKLTMFMAVSFDGAEFFMPYYREKTPEIKKASAEYKNAVLEKIYDRMSPVTINLNGEDINYRLQDLTDRDVFDEKGNPVLVTKDGLWIHDKEDNNYQKFKLYACVAEGMYRAERDVTRTQQDMYILSPSISEQLFLLEQKQAGNGE